MGPKVIMIFEMIKDLFFFILLLLLFVFAYSIGAQVCLPHSFSRLQTHFVLFHVTLLYHYI